MVNIKFNINHIETNTVLQHGVPKVLTTKPSAFTYAD